MTQLLPLESQVVVLTGATSGIGLAAARRLAARGARLVLVARNEGALADLVSEIEKDGGEAIMVDADVGDPDSAARIADAAEARFGRIDTWVNDAGVAIYGAIMDVSPDEHRRLFETNYWGLVHGSTEAVRRFRRPDGDRARGGVGKLINVGSVLSDRAMIFQGPYCASKHAVKGFTDALRMELEEAGEPVSVTLVKPAAIDTPYMEHAISHMDSEGTRNPPPSYDPELVAEAIEYACENDPRDLTVGGGGWIIGKMGQFAPALTDAAMKLTGRFLQTSSEPPRPGMRDNVFTPARDGFERSDMPGPPPRKTSAFLWMQMNPGATFAIGTIATVALLAATDRAGPRPARRSRR